MSTGDTSVDLTKSQEGAVTDTDVDTSVVEYIQNQYSETDYAIIIANHPVESWSSLVSADLTTLAGWEALADYFDNCSDCNFSWK